NAAGERLGPGIEGEICISGAGVAAGYWNRPDLTIKRFRVNPFDQTWPVLYHTGDLGAWRDDGELECFGRTDEQVKIRGVRVELGYVEARLRQLPGVGEAAVVARSFGPYDQRLVAYVVKGKPRNALVSEDLRAALTREIPEAFVPTTWHVVDSLPRLSNGKADRKSLMAGWPKQLADTDTCASPASLADQVAFAMAQVLGLLAMDKCANFFALGGDSLRAAQVVSKLRMIFGWSVPVSALLLHPTAELLTEFLEQAGGDAHGGEIERSPGNWPVALSASQRQLWLFHRLYPNTSVHNIGIVLRWRKPCGENEMRARCDSLMHRHVPLRSSGIAESQSWRCAEWANFNAPFERLDVPNLSDGELEDITSKELKRAFDLRDAPPWRFLFLDRGNENPWVMLSFHQLIVDQFALDTVLNELAHASPISNVKLSDKLSASLEHYRNALTTLEARIDRSAQEYWANAYRRPVTYASFPWDRPRTGGLSFAHQRTRRSLSADVVAQVEALARQEVTTPYVVLLCALAEALYRWSGRDDLIVGSAFSLRDNDPKLRDVVGFLASALPLRIVVLPHHSRRELLRRTHDVVMAAHQHKHCPPELVRAAVTSANASFAASPLPILFGFMPSIDRRECSPDTAEFDVEELFAEGIEGELHLQIRWSADGASIVLDGSADLFEERTIDALATQLAAALDMLLNATESQLVDNFSSPDKWGTDFASHSVYKAFERVAKSCPERIAISTSGGALTYDDLRMQVLAIVEDIFSVDQVGPCGLLFEDQALATAASLACLHRARTYIPLNRSGPARVQAKFTDPISSKPSFFVAMGIQTVLADQPMTDAARRLLPHATVITVSNDRRRAAQVDDPADPGLALAYVLCTSGTTGIPKGVAQSQRNLLHHATTYFESLGLRPDDRVSLLTTIDFDAAIMDIFGALLSGASLHVWPLRRCGFDGLAEWIEAESITVLHCTPSVFRALVAAFPDLRKHTNSVRFVVLGGEAARRSDLLDFRKAFAEGCVLVNGYGPTESTTATQAFFDRARTQNQAILPIGRPVGKTEVALTGIDGNAFSLVSEIVIRSPYISPGYVSSQEDLEQLSNRARNNIEYSVREYKTGDLVRVLPDGELLYVGRRDEQIKIAGIRTEIAEIEEALIACCDDLAEVAVVVGGPSGKGSPILAAFLVPKAGRVIDIEHIDELLQLNLSPHQLPNSFQIVSRLPYLLNGKINRRALKRAHSKGGRPIEVRAATGTDPQIEKWESIIATLWTKVLRLTHKPASTDTFLFLGGRSLEALVVLENLRRRFKVNVPTMSMLGSTSLRGAARLTAAAANAARSAKKDNTSGTETAGSKNELGPHQRSFWFAEQTSPGGAANRLLLALHLTGRATRQTITQILVTLVSRHEVLRSRIVLDGARLTVVTDDSAAPEIQWIEGSGVEMPISPKNLPDEFLRAFDLGHEWPVRALCISVPEADVLVLMFHHIAVDSRSVIVLAEEFQTLYATALGSKNIHPSESSTPDLPSYSSAMARIRARLTSEEEERQLAYWQRELSNAPAELKLPADEPRVSRTSQVADRENSRLPADLGSSLKTLCRRRGITHSSFFLAVWAIVLSLQSGDETVVVGLPVTLRALPDENSVVGPLLNTVALSIAMDWKLHFAHVATGVQKQMNSAIDHAYVPFERVVERLHPSRDLSRHPIYQASFSYHQTALPDEKTPIDQQANDNPNVYVLPTFSGGVTCNIALTVEETSDGIDLALDTVSGLILPQRRKRMLEHVLHVIDTVITLPDEPLDHLQLLPPAQRRQLLLQMNRGEVRNRRSPSILDSISAQVAVLGDATAFEGAWGTISYAEFQLRSDEIARELRHHGVGCGDYVPVMVSPGTPDVAIAIAAVWKAGAAHVPLDENWPKALVDRALVEAAAKVVIDRTLACLPCANRFAAEVERASGPDAISGLDNPIYAIYTSGSTGNPKAAVVAHRGIANRFSWMSDFAHAALSPPTTLQTTPAVYDSSIWQLFWPLTHGGRCVIPDPKSILDPEAITDLITRGGVDILDLVPSVAAALLPEFERSSVLRRRLERIRWLIIGGEALTPQLATRLRRLFSEARITNLYGPTEASIGCIFYELDDSIDYRLPIGRPIFNTQVALLDTRGQPAPKGTAGELCLLGDCVGLGYLSGGMAHGFSRCSLPEFGDVPIYRTGDTARWNERGYLEFHGRLDSQIKIRGHRIEPEGIEALIETHDKIERAAIALAETDLPEAVLKLSLFVEVKSGSQLDELAFRAWMRGVLPASHLPDTVNILPRLPITKAGKLDRTALPTARRCLLSRDIPSKIPADETCTTREAAVRRAWVRALGSAATMVSADTNFFDAGGHSFLLLALRTELDRECRVQLSILDLFKSPTIRTQAEAIGRIAGEAAGKPFVPQSQ
ncbi:MAG: non-ribosomal peptide synthetase, partial [Rhizobium sp.]|nr:non-ribosomal peptide synthetase [Rhizobium sp.]